MGSRTNGSRNREGVPLGIYGVSGGGRRVAVGLGRPGLEGSAGEEGPGGRGDATNGDGGIVYRGSTDAW